MGEIRGLRASSIIIDDFIGMENPEVIKEIIRGFGKVKSMSNDEIKTDPIRKCSCGFEGFD